MGTTASSDGFCSIATDEDGGGGRWPSSCSGEHLRWTRRAAHPALQKTAHVITLHPVNIQYFYASILYLKTEQFDSSSQPLPPTDLASPKTHRPTSLLPETPHTFITCTQTDTLRSPTHQIPLGRCRCWAGRRRPRSANCPTDFDSALDTPQPRQNEHRCAYEHIQNRIYIGIS
jgi:hypothetical protein